LVREYQRMEVDRCPADPDKMVETYLSGRLPEGQSAVFEDHFLGCPRCSERLQFTDAFITAVRHATERLRGAAADGLGAPAAAAGAKFVAVPTGRPPWIVPAGWVALRIPPKSKPGCE